MQRILIIDKMHDSICPLLEEAGFQPDYKPGISRAEILETVGEYEGMIVRSKTPIDKELIDKATKLEFVARAGAGVDQLDVEALDARGIKILNAPEGNRDAVGEHALGALLCLFNNIIQSDRMVREGLWDREGNRGVELKGMTVGIIGYGNMGRAFAQRLLGFECDVLAYDRYKVSYGDAFAKESSLEEIFEKADVLSLHTPLTEITRDMVDAEFLSKFKKPFYFVNLARGEVAMMKPLNDALDQGRMKGAVLDVLENEKFKTFTSDQQAEFGKLSARNNVVFTPHVGGWTFESYARINEVLVKKIKRLYAEG
ncbi:2-hydroxyacid dehydrogenase [Fulvitalea axinellae]|uniref:2-hydroxyacid dehydrogenase n=1 Tax=Fulvitalea axinellae TaxID=1182444 RepID=A0AAU9CI44_9BACT|nr:2-hydroxyacid dehydrogenase [Fulvitalea axinellae]